MLDFYYLPDGWPEAEDPAGLQHVDSLTFEAYQSMVRVADGQGKTFPVNLHEDQRLTVAEVERLQALLYGLRESGENRGAGNSAFEPMIRIVTRALEQGTGLQTVAD